MEVIEDSISVLESSSKKLNFTVNDMLSLAQIEKDKFRINLSTFDVREAVAEVVSIQKDKADFNQIRLSQEFSGFMGEYFVCTDNVRL